MRRKTTTTYLSISLLVVGVAVCCVDAAPARSGPKKDPREAFRMKEASQLANGWRLMYLGKKSVPAAVKAITPLLKSRDEATRVEASYLAGRILWNKGDKKSQDSATKRWETLSRQSTLNVLKPRLEITEALKLRAAGKPKEAMTKFESLLSNPYPDTCTPEAAILLAETALAAKDYKKATQAANFALGYTAKLLEMKELTTAQLAPFKARATKLKKWIIRSQRLAAQKKKNDAAEEKKPDAQKAYDAAAKLRVAKKYSPAVRAYMAVAKAHPDTQWAGRSQYDIGLCLRAETNEAGAIRWWKKFIDAMPDGPWRAQAYLQVIDAYMEHTLDVDAALEYATKAAGAIASAMRDKVGAPSWKLAALDLHLRVGLLSYVKGDTRQVAVSLTEAKKSAKAKTFRQSSIDGLNRLIASAKKGQPLLPVETMAPAGVTTPMTKAANCLGMGLVYHIMGRHHQADLYFGQVREKKAVRGTPAQIAFAEYGHGLVQRSLDEPAAAMKAFQYSLRMYSRGTWHDATLYQLATMTTAQAMAEVRTAKQRMEAAIAAAANSAATKSSNKPGAKKAPKPKTAKQLESEYAAAQRAFLTARRKAMFYWQAIYKKYPDSQYMEPAMYYAALLEYETAQAKAAAGGAGSAKAFEPVLVLMTAFVHKYPQSLYSGEIFTKRTGIVLERFFDLPAAMQSSKAAFTWAKTFKIDPKTKRLQLPAVKGVAVPPRPIWSPAAAESQNSWVLRQACYEIYLRAGLIAYLQSKTADAKAHYETARIFEVSEHKAHGYDTPIDRLVAAATGKKRLTPNDIMESLEAGPNRTALLLADLYLLAFRHDDAGAIYRLLLSGKAPLTRDLRPLVHAYTIWRGAQALEFQGKKKESLDLLKLLYAAKFRNVDYAAEGIFRLGTWGFNHSQSAKDSYRHWKHIFTNYPKHEEAHRSLFYYLSSKYEDKAYRECIEAAELYLARYPKGRWAERAEEQYLNGSKKKLLQSKKGNK